MTCCLEGDDLVFKDERGLQFVIPWEVVEIYLEVANELHKKVL
jgi:hypothetical protein